MAWIAGLFAAGSACFLVAPFPGFLQLVGPVADGVVFFVGSLLFTSAATLQWLQTINADRGPAGTARRRRRVLTFEPRRLDWWSSGIQLAGTLFFNATTFRALQTGLGSPSYDQVVWRPDALGSACFLVSGYLAYVGSPAACWGARGGRRSRRSPPSTSSAAWRSGSPPSRPTSSPRPGARSAWPW
jgi:hypothetical protein